MTAPGPGSAADEAAKLFAAVQGWARDRAAGFAEGGTAPGDLLGAEHLATGSAACTVCPVCQAIAAARQVRPETVEHLLDAAASVVAAVRSAVAGSSPPPPPGSPGPGGTAGQVQHIDVREV